MLTTRVRDTMSRLQGLFSGKAERAYKRRDKAEPESHIESFADGEAHAYGVASDDVREAREGEDKNEG